MRRWLGSWIRRSSLWRLLMLLLALAVLLVVAELHAWACTGGRGSWRELGQLDRPQRTYVWSGLGQS